MQHVTLIELCFTHSDYLRRLLNEFPIKSILKLRWSIHHPGTSFLTFWQMFVAFFTLRWRHNEGDSVSTHQPHLCLFSRLFELRSKKTSKLRVTGLCARNSPETGEFPAQMASNAENVSIWWRHHDHNHICHFNDFQTASWHKHLGYMHGTLPCDITWRHRFRSIST